MRRTLLALPLLVLLTSCAGPSNLNDICAIYDDKSGWHRAAKKASKKWNIPVWTLMAIMHQESRFDGDAKPPRKSKSSARGYAQAKKETWKWYISQTGNQGADRDNFSDAVDFIGWYANVTRERNQVSLSDTYSLYVAYHEGHGGFSRQSWEQKQKQWLLGVARKVEQQALRYREQYQKCD